MNEYDSNRIFDLVKPMGYQKTTNISETDCYVLNPCHIREKATDKVYHDVGRLKKEFKNKKKPILIVAGCVAQAEGNEMLKRENYIDGVIGPQSYHEIPKIIKKIEEKNDKINKTEFDTIEKFDYLKLIKNNNSSISSFLTIQEGCDKFCHFCVVPYTRGPEYSRDFKEIISEAKQLIDNGAKEITLLGQNVNAYRFKNIRLSDLIFKLEELNGLERIRYTTSHPKDMTKDLIEVYAFSKKIMPVLHLPVQSGSSKILRLMNRKHNIEEYKNIIDKIKKSNSNIKFTSDFIVGYPGETDKDFDDTIKLLQEVKFINTYSFMYSARPGTPASKLDNIELKLSKERLIKFQNLATQIRKEYREEMIKTTQKVLFENRLNKQDKFFGRDQFNNSYITSSKDDLSGDIFEIEINSLNHSTFFGELISKKKRNAA